MIPSPESAPADNGATGPRPSPVGTILLQTVGTGGQNYPVWEALAFTIRQRRPGLVCWICSEKSEHDTLPKIREQLLASSTPDRPASSPMARFEILRCVSEYQIDTCTSECLNRIKKLRADHPEASFEADFTSGTKVMSAAVVAAALIGAVPLLHYADGPRDESGRATSTDRLVTLDSGPITAEIELGELGNLFNRGQFSAVNIWAQRLTERLGSTGSLADRAKSLRYLSGICEAWDRFDFGTARAELRTTDPKAQGNRRRDELEAAGWSLAWRDGATKHLAACEEVNRTKAIKAEWLIDLYANAQRCCDATRYDDAVARLYRLVEGVGQFLLLKRGITSTSNVRRADLEKFAPRFLQEQSRADSVKLGLRENFAVLAEAGDEHGRFLSDLYGSDPRKPGVLGKLLSSRNQSLMAHGFQPVGREVASNLLRVSEQILRQVLGDTDLDAALQGACFPRCPWSAATDPWTQLNF
jgi:CRISPR-associated protein (TIGR02710 family)